MRRLLLLLATCAWGEDLYLASANAGAADATSCANARIYTWFNTAGNWGGGVGEIDPGDTVHVCGTISVAANGWAFAFQGSGTSGNPVTLLFETGAVLTSPAWAGGGGAIGLGGQSYIVIDGGTNGVIQATANGTGLSYNAASVVIGATGASNVEIKRLTFSSIFVHTQGATGAGDADFTTGGLIYANGFGALSIHDNVMHDIGWAINLQGGGSNSLSIYNNDIYNVDHGIALGIASAGQSLTNVSIHDNHIHDTAIWDTSTNTWHHDGIHAYNYGAGTADTWAIYNNLFDGDWGANNTAHIYMETNNFSNVFIYNNVFVQYAGNLLNNGMLAMGATTGSIYNNTFVCDSSVGGMVATTIYGTNLAIKNNVWSGCQTYLSLPVGNTFVASGLDYNAYSGSAGGGNGGWMWQGVGKATFALWKTASGGDASGANPASIGLSGSGVPQAGSALIGAGANLTSLGITALNSDKNGRVRGANWSIGAFEFAPPTTLRGVFNGVQIK